MIAIVTAGALALAIAGSLLWQRARRQDRERLWNEALVMSFYLQYRGIAKAEAKSEAFRTVHLATKGSRSERRKARKDLRDVSLVVASYPEIASAFESYMDQKMRLELERLR
jgi:hypothetical protein